MRSQHCLFILLIGLSCVFASTEKSARIAALKPLLHSFVTDCQVCKFLVGFHKDTPVYEALEEKLNSICVNVGGKYETMCQKVGAKLTTRIAESMKEKLAAMGDCASLCAAPQQVLHPEKLCPLVAPLVDNMDAHFETMVSDAAEFCRQQPNPFSCLDEIKMMAPHGREAAKRVVLRALVEIDSEQLCGVDVSKISGAEDLLKKGQQLESQSLKCSLCAQVCWYIGSALQGKAVRAEVDKVLVDVCKLLPLKLLGLPPSICTADFMDSLIDLLFQLFLENLLFPGTNGSTQLCHDLYNECQPPSS